ncbi:MAG: hypothetical protein KR126chlam1_01477 [Chlamydiae bacterium]|nr:hypothetical protein [Chlamydiota bacterium]
MKSILTLSLLLPSLLFSIQKNIMIHPGVEVPYIPWMTGSLLAPTPINMKPGHPAIEPSISIFNTYGEYDSSWKLKSKKSIWAINPLVDFQFAFTENTGLETIASFITSFKDGKSSTYLQDTIVHLGYQIADDQKDSWVPDLRLLFQTIFPTGKYRKLSPSKKGIDSTGQGAYFFGPNLSLQKLFYLPCNFFVLHCSFGYFFPTKAKLKGFNTYGGGYKTKGKLRPGQSMAAFFSGEYSFNQRWVFAYDTAFFHQRKSSHFRGNPGLTKERTPAKVGLPSSTQISFAPQIEYNFSSNSGLIMGTWFTLAGRNSKAFASAFLAYLYVF